MIPIVLLYRTCPACGTKTSRKSASCPKCGARLHERLRERSISVAIGYGLVLLLVLVFFVLTRWVL